MTLLLSFFLLLLDLALAFATPPEYEIVAAYSEKDHRIYGSETITFVNESDDPLSEIYLFLYPNLYSEDPKLDRGFYKRAYPIEFNPGRLIVTAIQERGGRPLPYSPGPFKRGILTRIALPTPIPPRETFIFLVHFYTVIPEKYGVFGYDRDLVTLQGGWHPYLPSFSGGKWNLLFPPPNSRFRVDFTLSEHFDILASSKVLLEGREGDDVTYRMEAEGLPYFSLSLGKGLSTREEKVGEIDLVYQFRPGNRSYADRTVEAAGEAIAYFIDRNGPLPPTRLYMAESDLYQDLVADGAGLLFLNRRLFKVFPRLRRFHEASVARGAFLLLWREKLPEEEAWLIEGMADLETEQFLLKKYRQKPNLETWLKPIGFIPLIDQILYSRDLPFRQIYFKEKVAPLLNEDIQVFNHPRPEGTTVFSKLKNLLGHEVVQRAVEEYKKEVQQGEKGSFRTVLYRVSGKKLDWFFDQWLMSNPALDFGIKSVRRERIGEEYKTTLTIRKRGEGIEPIEILTTQENGSRIPLVWEGDKETHEEVLITPSPIRRIELDPHKDSSDPNRADNRIPRPWKVLLNRFGASYNVNTGVLSYSAGLLFRPVYENQSQFGFYYADSEVGNASRVEWSQILKNNHAVTVGFSYQGRQTPRDKPPEEPAGTVSLGYALNYPAIPLFASFIQQLTGRYPLFSIGFGYDQRFTGGEYERLFKVTLSLRRIFSFSNYHEIGTRFFIGQTVGTLFENSRFFLGGDQGMRGFTPLRFEGDNIVLASAEYRFPIVYDTDLNLGGIALTHTLQGAFFADIGTVTDSRNPFEFTEYKRDIGGGVRWHVDMLGVYPTMLRFDVAVPVGSVIDAEKKLHYYITAGLPF
ncbi:MAG: BamA/TamA family outer membrane protein [Candidatus Manganitrophaceae bacterium]